MTGIVKIHGKEYKTVALRVSEFRDNYTPEDGWAIHTELIAADEAVVIMKASILNQEGVVVATGYAEEKRSSSQINRTSALENAETSAIGRALAAFGLGGTEYASANEVQNAIHQQKDDTEKRAKDAAKWGSDNAELIVYAGLQKKWTSALKRAQAGNAYAINDLAEIVKECQQAEAAFLEQRDTPDPTITEDDIPA